MPIRSQRALHISISITILIHTILTKVNIISSVIGLTAAPSAHIPCLPNCLGATATAIASELVWNCYVFHFGRLDILAYIWLGYRFHGIHQKDWILLVVIDLWTFLLFHAFTASEVAWSSRPLTPVKWVFKFAFAFGAGIWNLRDFYGLDNLGGKFDRLWK